MSKNYLKLWQNKKKESEQHEKVSNFKYFFIFEIQKHFYRHIMQMGACLVNFARF